MRRDEVFPSNYLKCEDLNRRDLNVTIKDVLVEKMGDDSKPVAYFYRQEKGLVLNQTNWDTIEALYGEESDDWLGKTITLYPAKAEFKGKRVDAIRIRDVIPEPPQHKNGPREEPAPRAKPVRPPARAAQTREPGDDDDAPGY